MADPANPAAGAAERRPSHPLDPRLVVGAVVIAALILVAVFAPLLAPHNPLEQDLMLSMLPPSWLSGGEPGYLLGTDSLGRDILSRLIFATRIALTVAFVAAMLAAAIGSLLGLLAGYFGGWVDQLVSRLIEVWMAFPPVLLAIVLAAVLGAGLSSVIVAIVVVDWTRFARVVRSETMVEREMEYVASAKTLGLSGPNILWKEVLPNVMPLVITLLSVEMGIAIVVEAILSFVGLSVSTDFPTWGGMIAEGRQVVYQTPWLLGVPICCIVVAVLGFNLMGDGLRQTIDPVNRR
ncbi:ABC-type dipeptide/oligopeptide/nickel transport system permease subunit [Amorphus suaedae]